MSNGDSTAVTSEDLNTELTNQGATANESNPIKVTFNDSKRQYNVYSNGIINFAGIKSDDEDNTDYAPYDNPYIPTNFSHIGTETWNQGFTIKGISGTANENDEFVWVPCVLDQSKVKSGDTVQTLSKITTGKYSSSDFVLHPSGGTNASVNVEDTTVEEIRTSVGTYGGFYIAKYEAGITDTEEKNLTDGSIKPLSQAEKDVWNYISRDNCLIVSKAMIPTATTGAKSTLISGECWDTTLAWITATADSSYVENSEGKGWYSDVSGSSIHKTGYYGTNTNNIYDMGGNVYEYTSENAWYEDSEEPYQAEVFRGGDCVSSGSVCPASIREVNSFGEKYRGFRVVLYK